MRREYQGPLTCATCADGVWVRGREYKCVFDSEAVMTVEGQEWCPRWRPLVCKDGDDGFPIMFGEDCREVH